MKLIIRVLGAFACSIMLAYLSDASASEFAILYAVWYLIISEEEKK